MTPDIQDAIVRAAQEADIDPAFALAVAQRESNGNPNARASRTIYGLFQMSGGLRSQYGIGDSNDPYTQARGWTRFIGDLKGEMADRLGRDPTNEELYLGHYLGGPRAARLISGQIPGSADVRDVFTPQELQANPEFGRAGTVGRLVASVEGDMTGRMGRFGQNPQKKPGKNPGNSGAPDFASFGQPQDGGGQEVATATDAELREASTNVGRRFPALATLLNNAVIERGEKNGPTDDRHLEFFSPDDKGNPHPGKVTVQIFDNLRGDDLSDAIAGDLLHHLGGVDTTTGKPVDPAFYALKQEMAAAREPFHLNADRDTYEREKANQNYDTLPYAEWDQRSRVDAYVRGAVFPKQNPEWNTPEQGEERSFLTPKMLEIGQRMRDYLSRSNNPDVDFNVPTSPAQPVDFARFGSAANSQNQIAPDPTLAVAATPVSGATATAEPQEITAQPQEHLPEPAPAMTPAAVAMRQAMMQRLGLGAQPIAGISAIPGQKAQTAPPLQPQQPA